jgi:hypothetical protein
MPIPPLKPSTCYVLLALGDGELHGYAIMQTIAEMTGGRETILPGTLYAALARMVDDGLIEEREAPAEDASGGVMPAALRMAAQRSATSRAISPTRSARSPRRAASPSSPSSRRSASASASYS